jgi:hypothetical protein
MWIVVGRTGLFVMQETLNPLIAQLTHRPFPEVAEILRAGTDQITHEWDAAVRVAMPQMQHLTYDELKDSTPEILLAIANALASDDPNVIRELINRAPSQGLSRFRLNFDVIEVMQEDRLLRAITVHHVAACRDRRHASAIGHRHGGQAKDATPRRRRDGVEVSLVPLSRPEQ